MSNPVRRIAVRGDARYIISASSAKLLDTLLKGHPLSYSQLSQRTGIPLASLYVFASRLVRCKLITSTRTGDHHTLAAKDGITFLKAKYIG